MMKLLAFAIALLFGLVACTPGAPATEPGATHTGTLLGNEEVSAFQQEALSDGEVTREEFDQAFDNYRRCMEGIGYPLIDVVEKDLQYDFSYPEEATAHGADECYFYEFAQVHGGWSLRPEVAELDPLSPVIRECLLAHGITPEDTHIKRVDQVLAHGLLDECIAEIR